jgi:hypothetical protein
MTTYVGRQLLGRMSVLLRRHVLVWLKAKDTRRCEPIAQVRCWLWAGMDPANQEPADRRRRSATCPRTHVVKVAASSAARCELHDASGSADPGRESEEHGHAPRGSTRVRRVSKSS